MACVPRKLAFLKGRFAAKTVPGPNGCILWTGAIDNNGYGTFICWPEGEPRQRTRKAHQWAFEWAHGPMPVGLETDHVCRVRHCVNPAHLRAVTHRENLAGRVVGQHVLGGYCRVEDPRMARLDIVEPTPPTPSHDRDRPFELIPAREVAAC